MSDVPNWIKARAECPLEKNFTILAKAIKGDVTKFNALSTTNRAGKLFIVKTMDSGMAVMRATRIDDYHTVSGKSLAVDPDYEQDFIHIDCGAGAITARRQDRFELTVFPRWNADTLTCDMYIGDRSFPFWNISERILEPFLFGDDG